MSDELILTAISRLYPGRQGQGFNVLDYVHAEGSPAVALLYARLFWPEFSEFEEMVFLKETVEDGDDRLRIRQALVRYAGDRTKTEQSFNCHDLEALFGARAGDAMADEGQLLMRTLREMWQARLERIWPDRRFRVALVETEPGEENVGLMFWCERGGAIE